MMFYIPLLYLIKTRAYTFSKLVSWIILYCIPLFAICLFQNQWDFSKLPLLLFCIILIYDVYEIGYIQNDAETIKKETNPTKRLSEKELSHYEANKFYIYAVRVLWSIAGISFLLIYFDFAMEAVIFSCMLYLLIPCYLIYNSRRNQWCLPVNFVLISIRYLAPLVLLKLVSSEVVVTVLCIYPVINFIERAATSKFAIPVFKKLIPEKQFLTTFRVAYYFVLLLLFLAYHFMVDNILFYTLIVAYCLLFRCFSFVVVKRGMAPQNYLGA